VLRKRGEECVKKNPEKGVTLSKKVGWQGKDKRGTSSTTDEARKTWRGVVDDLGREQRFKKRGIPEGTSPKRSIGENRGNTASERGKTSPSSMEG